MKAEDLEGLIMTPRLVRWSPALRDRRAVSAYDTLPWRGNDMGQERGSVNEKPENGSTCDRETVRPFKGLFDWAWIVRRMDDNDKDLDNYVLWREIKKQVRILREELKDEGASRRLWYWSSWLSPGSCRIVRNM